MLKGVLPCCLNHLKRCFPSAGLSDWARSHEGPEEGMRGNATGGDEGLRESEEFLKVQKNISMTSSCHLDHTHFLTLRALRQCLAAQIETCIA